MPTNTLKRYVSYSGEWVEVPLIGGAPTGEPPAGEEGAWERPAEWLPLDVTAGEQKIALLVAVGLDTDPVTSRQMTIKVTTNPATGYTVDWGDGSAPENLGSGIVGKHTYTGTGLTPLTGTGLSQAVVTITAQGTATFTVPDFTQAYDTGKTWRSPVLEIVAGPGTITGMTLSNAVNLHQLTFLSPVTLTGPASMFASCNSLRAVKGSITTANAGLSSMFSGCVMLEQFPDLTLTATANISFSSMFGSCASMRTVPNITVDWSAVTNWSMCFTDCVTLREVPDTWQIAGTNWQMTFSGCRNLRRVGYLDGTAVTTTYSMFVNCVSLEEIPPFLTPVATDMSSTFSSCSNLPKITIDTSAAQKMGSLFNSCGSLAEVDGTLTFANVTTSSNMSNPFTGTYSLRKLLFAPGGGPLFTFTLVGMLDAAGLNQVYTDLPTVTGQTITVTNIPGTLGDDPSIAQAKGWTVTGS